MNRLTGLEEIELDGSVDSSFANIMATIPKTVKVLRVLGKNNAYDRYDNDDGMFGGGPSMDTNLRFLRTLEFGECQWNMKVAFDKILRQCTQLEELNIAMSPIESIKDFVPKLPTTLKKLVVTFNGLNDNQRSKAISAFGTHAFIKLFRERCPELEEFEYEDGA